jgi:acyl-CoA reductase-like NAD-dependent aldehyde dehydrogenase
VERTTIVKRINCVCGRVVEGKDDYELWDKAQAHLAAHRPGLDGGLSAAIFTRSLGRAHCLTDLAEVGEVAVNLPTSSWDVHMPFGGFRESESAFREQGLEALRFYTRTKTVAVHYGS